MASTAQAVLTIARVAGINGLTFDGRTRPLRDAGLVSLTGRGGGRGIVHVEGVELVRIILALCAPSATRVVEVVETLSGLTWVDPQPGDFGSLGTELEAEITWRALRITRGDPPPNASGATAWTLSICADPPTAWLSWTIGGHDYHRHYAPPAGGQNRPLMHVFRIGKEIIDCAAELLADSLLGNVPKRKTAATPARDAAAQPGACETETLPNTAHPTTGAVTTDISLIGQGRVSQKFRKPTRKLRDAHDDRCDEIAAMLCD